MQRLEPLPRDTRRLVLAAAADPVGDAALLWRACERLGISADAAVPAVEAGLLKAGWRVTFFHPLVRSAVYQGASAADRREVHRALADATDPERDPDRRAWHRAQAASGPDEDVAAELERSADRAQAPRRARRRGRVPGARGDPHRRAAEAHRPRARRRAGQVRRRRQRRRAGRCSGSPSRARPTSSSARGWSGCARASPSRQRRGGDAPPLLLQAARRLEPLDPALARETYLQALGASLSTGQRDSLERAAAGRCAPRRRPSRRAAAELLMLGQALLITDGRAAGTPELQRGAERDPQRATRRARTRCRGCCSRAWWRSGSGTTRAGMSCRPATCSSRATPARSRCSRSRSRCTARAA